MKSPKALKRIFPQFFLNALVFIFLLFFLASDLSAQSSTIFKSSWAKSVPTLDGKINSSEWSDALKTRKTINLFDTRGQKRESHPLTLYIKNDAKNLYLAGRLDNEEHEGTIKGFDFSSLVMDMFSLVFDDNRDGVLQSGEDKKSFFILNQTPTIKDEHQLSPAEQQQGKEESSEPQNIEGQITYTSSGGGYYQFELSIALNSGDPSDVQLQPGQKVRWNLFYFDKFSFTMKERDLGFGGVFPENSKDWGYLQLADQSNPSPDMIMAPAVSKSSPGVSTTVSDIQVFAQVANEKDLDAEQLKFIGTHYDLVLSFFPYKQYTDQLKQPNPKLPVYLFVNPYFAFGDKFWNTSSPGEAAAAERRYSLKTSDNKTILFNLNYPGLEFDQRLPLMDIRNTEWQDYFTSQIRKHADLGGMDGIFLDTMDERLPSWAMAPGNKTPKGYSDAQWKAANYEFLEKINNAFAGTGKEIVFNGISRVPGNKGELPNEKMLDVTSGAAIEAFSIYMSMDKSEDTRRWYFQQTIMKDLKTTSERGKKVIIEVYGNRDDEAIRLYALCSFLLVQNDWTYFYFTKKSDAGGLRWRPEWDTQLGQALGSYQKTSNGIHSREFSKGKVLVNPGNKAISVQLSGQYKDWKGNRIGSSVKMPAFSGILLLKG